MARRATTIVSAARCRAPRPVLAAFAALLAAAPVGLALSRDDARGANAAPTTLRQIAREAGCALREYDSDPHTNPPVSGPVDERATARDGSYVGRTGPSAAAAIHALLHGRVLLQYRPDLPAAEVRALDRLVRANPEHVLLFANRTGMAPAVAATAYLTMLTCERVDGRTLPALRAFRDRRSGFGQSF